MKPPNGTVGLFTLAADLRGAQIYLDTITNPALVERLMDIVTDKVIQRLEHVRREYGYPFADSYICDDASAQLSPGAYRRFVLPYNRRLKEHFGGKLTLHCCGRAGHLVPIWADELGVDILWNFSYETDRRKVAQRMGGKTVLVGNVNWKLVNAGTPEEVYADALDAIEVFSAHGGHILSSPNIPPSVSAENLNAMTRAAKIRAAMVRASTASADTASADAASADAASGKQSG
jgi:uroporphyrinogen-III decarboxylase